MYQTNYRLNFLFPVQLMLNDTDGVYNFSGMVELQVTLGPGFSQSQNSMNVPNYRQVNPN